MKNIYRAQSYRIFRYYTSYTVSVRVERAAKGRVMRDQVAAVLVVQLMVLLQVLMMMLILLLLIVQIMMMLIVLLLLLLLLHLVVLESVFVLLLETRKLQL